MKINYSSFRLSGSTLLTNTQLLTGNVTKKGTTHGVEDVIENPRD